MEADEIHRIDIQCSPQIRRGIELLPAAEVRFIRLRPTLNVPELGASPSSDGEGKCGEAAQAASTSPFAIALPLASISRERAIG